ncbi:MAG: glycosyltransferase family 4 protein [Methanomassiliicoccus sp.]|nr:MAG: glycosyltransferase family 4 protein [Methanomassiliicoccus sp.]
MFADSFYPTIDGAVISMETQARGLEARGHEVVMFAPDTPKRLKMDRPVHYFPSFAFRSYTDYRIVWAAPRMMECVRKERVDVLHCHGLASMAILSLTVARALNIPHVLTFHTMANEAVKYYSFVPLREDMMVPMVWIYLRNLLRRPEVVIAPSAPIRDELIENRIKMKACEVVPTGIDIQRFTPKNHDPAFLERWGLDGNRVILHVGRLSFEKRLDIVLNAMADLRKEEPDLRLLVVGKGPASDHYQRLAESLGIKDRVVFTGFLPDDDLPKAYASCDMLVIASTFETQGLVVLEAMASGTPVAGIRSRAIPEFVKEGKNGCLFDETSCTDAIRRCLSKANSMKMEAVAMAMGFSIDTCTAKLEKTYDLAAEIMKNDLENRWF